MYLWGLTNNTRSSSLGSPVVLSRTEFLESQKRWTKMNRGNMGPSVQLSLTLNHIMYMNEGKVSPTGKVLWRFGGWTKITCLFSFVKKNSLVDKLIIKVSSKILEFRNRNEVYHISGVRPRSYQGSPNKVYHQPKKPPLVDLRKLLSLSMTTLWRVILSKRMGFS